jgi:hypothetical protein
MLLRPYGDFQGVRLSGHMMGARRESGNVAYRAPTSAGVEFPGIGTDERRHAGNIND